MNNPSEAFPSAAMAALGWNPALSYMVDAWQRSVLFLDVLGQRAENSRAHNARTVPNVLRFDAELILDGRTLEHPVNYALARIAPPPGVPTDPRKRPYIIVDPRAGHGPGIGGMKHDSEIGEVIRDGHPCYFVGFLPAPMPGQTIEDVCRAEAIFVEAVAARHPDAEGKPALIGNCQAGWQIMMMAAIRPQPVGPILLAGTPLSYWAGVRGRNPLRYLGGLLGGTWLTALAGDLGHGIFDGANLVANFEQMNPANTYWQKPYNVYAKIDTEPPRFLEFEKWWGSPVLLNADEMQWIADNLFVGNRLTRGELHTKDGVRVDLRNIRSPIIVFCSWGDDITPPQQALGWVTDLYDDVEQIVDNGQTIVYTLHQSVGHLGIFVSGKVANKENDQLVGCMDMIDMMPPGLYEAVITDVAPDTANPSLVHGHYLFRLEARTLDDIRALGNNDAEDERRFETAARVSDVNLGLYRTFFSPAVRAVSSEQSAAAMRELHPNRLRFSAFSERSPAMSPVRMLAEHVRANRQPVDATNPFRQLEQMTSDWIGAGLDAWGSARDMMTEAFFLGVYGSPLLQALVGLGDTFPERTRGSSRDLLREATVAEMRQRLAQRFEVGGLPEATARAALHIRLPLRSADERGFAMMREIAAHRPAKERISPARYKEILAEQYLLLRMDEARAVDAIPRLLPEDAAARRIALDHLRRVVTASGTLPPECKRRLARIEAMFMPAHAKSATGSELADV